jgi:hypothetical protein
MQQSQCSALLRNLAAALNPRVRRVVTKPTLFAMLAAVLTLGTQPAAAQQFTITVTGTVYYGTDSSTSSGANVFGSGTNLAGLPFTLTLDFNSADGTASNATCSGGAVYSTTDTGTDTSPSGTLHIGGGSFAYGSLPRTASWSVGRTALTSLRLLPVVPL